MEIWKTFLFVFGGNAGLLLAIGYLVKSLLDKRIVQDTKRFEIELKAKSDAAIEHVRNTLQLQAIEHQVRFSRLHDKRASVIAELYGYLVKALLEAEDFLHPIQDPAEGGKKESQAMPHKLIYFDTNIYAIVKNHLRDQTADYDLIKRAIEFDFIMIPGSIAVLEGALPIHRSKSPTVFALEKQTYAEIMNWKVFRVPSGSGLDMMIN